MTCCDNPQPRILRRNGRFFCGNCLTYLSTSESLSDEPILEVEIRPPEPDERDSEDLTASEAAQQREFLRPIKPGMPGAVDDMVRYKVRMDFAAPPRIIDITSIS